MGEDWNRRRFLKRVGLAGAGVAGTTALGFIAVEGVARPTKKSSEKPTRFVFKSKSAGEKSVLAIGRGDPASAVKAALGALGGMRRFVNKGEKVVIKPNVAWDRTPAQAANTNPVVVATLVELCLEAGVKKVVVTDNPCNDAERCFTRSGIWKSVEAAGGEVVLPADHRFMPMALAGVLGTIPVLMPAVEADRLINVAIAKHHGLTKFTGAMKNLYGMIGGRRNRHHQSIDDSIVDLASSFQATLTLMDATRVLLRNGPQGGDLSDTKEVGEVIASTDPVAVDAYACGLIGLSPRDLPYLTRAAREGLGTSTLNAVEKLEVS